MISVAKTLVFMAVKQLDAPERHTVASQVGDFLATSPSVITTLIGDMVRLGWLEMSGKHLAMTTDGKEEFEKARMVFISITKDLL